MTLLNLKIAMEAKTSTRAHVLSLAADLAEALDGLSDHNSDLAPFAQRSIALHRDLASDLPADVRQVTFNAGLQGAADELDAFDMVLMGTGALPSNGLNEAGFRTTDPTADWRPSLKRKANEVRSRISSLIMAPNVDTTSLVASVKDLQADLHRCWRSNTVLNFSKDEADRILARAILALHRPGSVAA